MSVDDIYTVTGMGTVFAGNVRSGSIAVGDPIVCRIAAREVPVRVIALRDAAGKSLKSAEAGGLIGVVCNTIDLKTLDDAFSLDEERRVFPGVSLVTAPAKKHWWQ